jgi:hypothetical protein
MIRALRPTDALAYVEFWHQVAADRRESGDGGAPPFQPVPTLVGFLGRSLALEAGRESWVQIERGQISGLVTAKRREGTDVWDVDQLAVLPRADAGRTCVRLLEQLLTAAVDEGVHKVFLRLDEDDPAQEWARQVGFFQYVRETLYYRTELPTLANPPSLPGVRPRRAADHQGLFQLYSAAVPIRVRQAEAMTLQEWRWMDGWGMRPVTLRLVEGGQRSDYVVETDGRLGGWLQVDRRRRRLACLTDPRDSVDEGALLALGMRRLKAGRAASCYARDYQSGLANALEELGFSVIRRDALYARALAARIPEVKLVPVRA